jgi:transcriptional regulator with XRE-family HTH domain
VSSPSLAEAPFVEEATRLLAERGLSQRALGRRIGINQAHVSRILSGQTVPTLAMIDAIAAALELPADYFVESQLRTIAKILGSDPRLRRRVYQQVTRAAGAARP